MVKHRRSHTPSSAAGPPPPQSVSGRRRKPPNSMSNHPAPRRGPARRGQWDRGPSACPAGPADITAYAARHTGVPRCRCAHFLRNCPGHLTPARAGRGFIRLHGRATQTASTPKLNTAGQGRPIGMKNKHRALGRTILKYELTRCCGNHHKQRSWINVKLSARTPVLVAACFPTKRSRQRHFPPRRLSERPTIVPGTVPPAPLCAARSSSPLPRSTGESLQPHAKR